MEHVERRRLLERREKCAGLAIFLLVMYIFAFSGTLLTILQAYVYCVERKTPNDDSSDCVSRGDDNWKSVATTAIALLPTTFFQAVVFFPMLQTKERQLIAKGVSLAIGLVGFAILVLGWMHNTADAFWIGLNLFVGTCSLAMGFGAELLCGEFPKPKEEEGAHFHREMNNRLDSRVDVEVLRET
eukprot:TRINITY_DN67314_c5_g1_i3.p1 TRINITY_DN67314_c5_g1~~TRINITY_DN67314_c5_g1_i3.p1  ORF type:complete len:185 (+),score=7.25 TRINITY_DN67314_c5_g1_i3:80-634(+)